MNSPVADSDLQIRREGVGGGYPDPEMWGNGLKKFFSALRV